MSPGYRSNLEQGKLQARVRYMTTEFEHSNINKNVPRPTEQTKCSYSSCLYGNTVTYTIPNRCNSTQPLTAAAAQQNDNTQMFLPATTHSHVIVCCEVLPTSLKQNANYNTVLLTSMRYIINYNLFLLVFPLLFDCTRSHFNQLNMFNEIRRSRNKQITCIYIFNYYNEC